mgnify:CR=1 FL=1
MKNIIEKKKEDDPELAKELEKNLEKMESGEMETGKYIIIFRWCRMV